ncbi:unnamed protein product [Peronospora destructor]|uniref:Reverse transcriptase Ty1/copia-type domain-containing protein n=1 Tax=Peronospora destructor TaxID=86335 RepID=A0AAV0THB1_9STRA|nr:unnamed protein product [Peronospora destructor]
MSPLEMLTGETPSISDIVVFGSPCTVHRNPGKKAWKHRAEVGVIVGKHDKTKDYKVYIPLDRVVVTTQHVTNVETLDVQGNRHLQEQLKRKDPTLEQSILGHEESARQKEQLNSPELNGRDTAERKEPQRNGKKKRGSRGKGTEGKSCCVDSIVKDTETVPREEKLAGRMTTRHMDTKHVPVAMVAVISNPKTYREAMQSSRSSDWQKAMSTEIESLETNDTWEVVPKPSGQKMLHPKWVYKTKRRADGTLERYKARLVACGNEQSHGIDYTMTFSAVMNMTTASARKSVASPRATRRRS